MKIEAMAPSYSVMSHKAVADFSLILRTMNITPAPIGKFGFAQKDSSNLEGCSENRARTFDVRRFRFLPSDQVDATVNLSDQPEILFQTGNIAPRVFELRESTRSTDNYLADHNIYSGYMMLDLPLSTKWQVMSGVRLESSDQTVTTYDPFAATRKEIEANLRTLDWLPGFKCNVSPNRTDEFAVRSISYDNAPGFPGTRTLLSSQISSAAGRFLAIQSWNVRRSITSIFVGKFFPQIGGILAVSAFYKRFQKPIEQIVQPQAEVRITYENAEGAHNYGLELEARQNLGVLTDALRNFSINTNAALISSQVVLPEDVGIQTSSERPLQGQCPYIVNVSIGY